MGVGGTGWRVRSCSLPSVALHSSLHSLHSLSVPATNQHIRLVCLHMLSHKGRQETDQRFRFNFNSVRQTSNLKNSRTQGLGEREQSSCEVGAGMWRKASEQMGRSGREERTSERELLEKAQFWALISSESRWCRGE